MGEQDFDDFTSSQSDNTPYPTRAPAREDTSGYVNILEEQPQRFLLNAYNYTGGFRDGSYLVPYPVEGYYQRRRAFSYYVNFFCSIVDAMVRAVFSNEANRQVRSGETVQGIDSWDAFLSDADGSGVSLHTFMKQACQSMRSVSAHYIVVDNFTNEEQPEDMATAVSERVIPYVYHKNACDVTGYGKDKRGKLLWIMFYDRTEKVMEKEGRNEVWKDVVYHRKWTDEYTVEMIETREGSTSKFTEVTETMVMHNLGVIPVVGMYDKYPERVCDLLPDPRMYGVGRLAHAIFNKDSEARELERRCEFPVLTLPGDMPSDVSLGAGNLLTYPIDSTHTPDWISPSADTLKALVEARGELRDDIYRLAEQNGVVGKPREAKSGVAMAYDFKPYRETLEETANISQSAEIKIFEIFRLYMDLDANLEYDPGYDTEYMPTDYEQQSSMYQAMLDQNPPPEIEKDIWNGWYSMGFPEASDERVEVVEKDVEKYVDEKATVSGDQTFIAGEG